MLEAYAYTFTEKSTEERGQNTGHKLIQKPV